MTHYCRVGLFALLYLAVAVSSSRADGLFRRKAPPPPEAPIIVTQPTVPVLPAPTPVRPMTHAEFARLFQPIPGTHHVTLLHPFTGCAVNVCFTLPPGCPKKVRVERRELEFDYGRHEVEIRFLRNGRVQVKN